MAEISREKVDCCDDNRYELIEKYKNKLIESTNIDSSEDEMKVIDNIFFRLWQMDWLDNLEKLEKIEQIVEEMWDENSYYNNSFRFAEKIEQIVKG